MRWEVVKDDASIQGFPPKERLIYRFRGGWHRVAKFCTDVLHGFVGFCIDWARNVWKKRRQLFFSWLLYVGIVFAVSNLNLWESVEIVTLVFAGILILGLPVMLIILIVMLAVFSLLLLVLEKVSGDDHDDPGDFF